MEDIIKSWITHNKETTEAFSMNIIEIHTEFVKLEIAGYTIQLIMPHGFHDADNMDSDSTFLAIHCEEAQELDATLKEVLTTLNEKFERVRIGPNCLNRVLDSTLQVFSYYRCKKRHKVLEFSSRKQGNSSGYKSSYLYKASEEARVECKQALYTVDEKSILDGRVLPWCSVSADPSLGTVELGMEIDGIMAPYNVTKALGFCFDSPLKIKLGFKTELWLTEQELPPQKFREAKVRVTSDQVGISVQSVPDEWDERMRLALSKCCLKRVHQHGPQVLVPELVWEFFKNHGERDDGLLNCLGQAEGSSNVFVRLLVFVGTRLSTLGSWCCNCKKELSPLSRLWYCDADFCLFRYEELGVGASVLQELQNSELVELELSFAIAASTSVRNIFEPYPSFLLRHREIRGRSGFFSTGMSRKSTKSLQSRGTDDVENEHIIEWDNKKMGVLKLVLNSFPPVADMQKCENEFDLRLMLSTTLQKLVKSDKFYEDECFQKEFVKDLWLPYNVLRFVLFTNRLTLNLLKNEFKLEMPGSHHQFAVLYDSEKEKCYEHCRATNGSFFAYHGSSAENWYSILRNGLRCLSGTDYMCNGMAHGQGIYFSNKINVSAGYCKARSGWRNGNLNNFNVIAICEIFLDPVNRTTSSHTVVTAEHENCVVIRYLIVFSGNWEGGSNLNLPLFKSNLELHEHYKKVRADYLQKLANRDLVMQKQRLAVFNKRRVSSQCSS